MKKISILTVFSFLILLKANSQSENLQDYTGVYIFPDGSVVSSVEVTIADSVLKMSSEAVISIITREGRDTFFIVEFSGIAIFKRDSTNKVNAVHIEAGGYILDGKKQEKENSPMASHFLQRKDPAFFRREKV